MFESPAIGLIQCGPIVEERADNESRCFEYKSRAVGIAPHQIAVHASQIGIVAKNVQLADSLWGNHTSSES